jgi:hypothetical protein
MTLLTRASTGPLMLGTPPAMIPLLSKDLRVQWVGEQPLLTPIDLLPWWSTQFFRSRPDLQPVFHVDWQVAASAPTHVLAATPGTWVTEVPRHLQGDAVAAVVRLAEHAGRTARAFPLLGDEEAVEEHFVASGCRNEPDEDRRLVMRHAWARVTDQRGPADLDDGVVLYEPGGPLHFDELWTLYRTVMEVLSEHHPIAAVLPREQFEQVACSEQGALFVRVIDRRPASMALMSTDVSAFEWLDAHWEQRLRDTTGISNIVVVPGIVTTGEHRHRGLISGILDCILDMCTAVQCDVLATFPCNNLSRNYTPAIAGRVVDRYRDFHGAVERTASYDFMAFDVS